MSEKRKAASLDVAFEDAFDGVFEGAFDDVSTKQEIDDPSVPQLRDEISNRKQKRQRPSWDFSNSDLDYKEEGPSHEDNNNNASHEQNNNDASHEDTNNASSHPRPAKVSLQTALDSIPKL